MSLDTEKRAVRDGVRARVAAMSPAERDAASDAVRRWLAGSDAWARARVVLLYAADATEPDLDGLIELGAGAGKTVCVPRVDWAAKRMEPAAVASSAELVEGRHGIRSPGPGARAVPPESVDLVVVPGVAFDRAGGRLGRGGGFYDRFLADLSSGGSMVAIGACFAAQIVDRVPLGPHDRRVDGLVTEAGLVTFGRGTEVPG